MAKTITVSGDTFRQFIFGVGEHEDRKEYDKNNGSQFYYRGGSHRQAAENYHRRNNPYARPLPFVIPSGYYSDHHYQNMERYGGGPYYTDEEWKEHITPPKYIVSSGLFMGGRYNYETASLIMKEFGADIMISNCNFDYSVTLQQLDSKYDIKFRNCSFKENFQLINIKVSEISFDNCQFNGKLLQIRDSDIKTLCIINCRNLSIEILNDSRQAYSIGIVNDFTHKIDYFLLSKSTEIDKINIEGKAIGEIILEDFKAKSISFNVSIDGFRLINRGKEICIIDSFIATIDEEKKGFISILENLDFDTFELTGTLKDSTLLLINDIAKKISIHNFINEGKIRFNNFALRKNGECEFVRSQLGKAEFNYVDLSKAKHFKIYLSNITEIITNNTDFPSNIFGKDEDDFKGKREIYRQLKNAASKQADKVKALHYEGIEMQSYEKVLASEKRKTDLFILKSNRWSNRYGQDWYIAGKNLLIYLLIAFCLIRLCLGYWQFNFSLIFSDIATFLNFSLNPLHKFSEVFNKSENEFFTGLSQFIDILARLFSGYMIFQFLQAFRKYAR